MSKIVSTTLVLLLLGPAASSAAQMAGVQRLDVMGAAGATESDEPELAQADGVFHAVWFELNATTNKDLYYARSLDKGRSWSAPLRLDQDPGVGNQDNPIVLAEANVVVVAWFDDRDTASEDDVIARVSTDRGATFGPEVSISGPMRADGADADRLRGAISLPYVHIGFEDNLAATDPLGANEDLYVASSSDAGATFSAPQAVNRPPGGIGSADIDAPGLAAVGATVHVAWADARNGSSDHVYYNRSTDGGATFGVIDVQLDTTAPATSDADEIELSASGVHVYVNWQDNRDDPAGANKVYMNASNSSGAGWLGDVRVGSAAAATDTSSAAFAVDGADFLITWEDNRNNLGGVLRDVFVARGTIGGGSVALSPEQRMDVGSAPGAANSSRSRLAWTGSTVFLVYKDSRKDPGALNDSLFLRVSTDSGVSFGAEIDLTPALTGADDAEEQNLAVTDDLDLVCLWADDRNGTGIPRNNDLFASHGCFRPASATSRNGTGVNPVLLTNTSPPVLGTVWTVQLDCTGFESNLCGVLGYAAPATGPVLRFGEVLVDLARPKYYQVLKPHSGNVVSFGFPLPLDTAFCGVPVYNQAVVFGNPGPQVTNAIDVRLGGL